MRGAAALTLIALTCLTIQPGRCALGLLAEEIMFPPPPPPTPSVTLRMPQTPSQPPRFKGANVEVKILNATCAKFAIAVGISNPSDRALAYIVELHAPRKYVPYPSAAREARPRIEVKVTSDKLGELNVTVDRWGNVRAKGALEGGGEDTIRLEGWVSLVQSRRAIWRENVEGNLGFSISFEGGLEAPPGRGEAKIKISYPEEYARSDEANYQVTYVSGFKTIEYVEEFYGGLSLSLDMYKPRIPVNALAVFLALWAALVAFVVKKRGVSRPEEGEAARSHR